MSSFTIIKLVTTLLVGSSKIVQAQAIVPTKTSDFYSEPMTTSIWWPKGIPGDEIPDQINGTAMYNTAMDAAEDDSATWTLTGQFPAITAAYDAARTGPTYYWPELTVRYTSKAAVFSVDYRRGQGGNTVTGGSTYIGIMTHTFVQGNCTSSESTAQCSGSYGVIRITSSTVLPSGRTALSGGINTNMSYLTEVDIKPFPTNPQITTIPVSLSVVRVTTRSSTHTASSTSLTDGAPGAATSSSTGGVPRATGNAGALAGAAALVGGAMVLV